MDDGIPRDLMWKKLPPDHLAVYRNPEKELIVEQFTYSAKEDSRCLIVFGS